MASLVKSVMVKIVASDADAEEKLDRITMKADELRAKNPELKIRIDTAEATAKLAVFREELKAATRTMTADVETKAGSRGLLGRLLFGAAASEAEGGGGSGGGLTSLFEGGLTSPGGITLIVGAVAALIPELVALVSGLAAATAGVGAFGLLALPTFEKVKNAYTAISTAQKNYQAAAALNKEDPTKAHAAAAAAALLKLKVAEESMSPATRQAVKGIQELLKSFDKMAKAFEPTVMKVFNDGLKLANDLLPALKPLAEAAGGALGGLLKDADKFAQSKGFKDWLSQFSKLVGPSITAIGHGIGDVITNLGKLFTTMSKKDVVNGINIAFRIISGTITALIGITKGLMIAWDYMSAAVIRDWHDVRQWTLDVWHAIDQVVHNIIHAYDNWQHAGGNLTHAFGNVVHFIETAMTDIGHAVSTGITDVINFFKALPGKIVSALASLGQMLFNIGKNVLEGLWNGLKSAAGGVLHWASGFASDIGHAFSSVLHIFSPSKVFEEHGRNIVRGLVIGLNSEAPSALAAISNLGLHLGTGINAAAGTGGRGSAPIVIQLQLTGGDSEFRTFLGSVLRAGGGDPRLLTRKVVLA